MTEAQLRRLIGRIAEMHVVLRHEWMEWRCGTHMFTRPYDRADDWFVDRAALSDMTGGQLLQVLGFIADCPWG